MDETYWQARCRAAEDALRRARSRLWLSPARRRALAVLAQLKPGESLATCQVAERLGCGALAALRLMHRLSAVGLVDGERQGGPSAPLRWSLGHLVVVDELALESSAE